MEEIVETSGNHAYRPAPLRATLAWLCVTAALAGAGFAGIAIWSDYVQTRRQAEQHLEAAAALVEEHALGAIGAADQLTARAVQFVRGKAPGDLWDDWAQWAELRTMADSLPYVVSLLVVDRNGVVMLGSRAFPAGKTDVSDRVYFRALREGDETHIGRTILGRSAGRFVFTVSRRLDAPDGTFGGAVAVTLDTRYFLEAYRKSGLGSSAALTVVRTDGTVIVRHPFSAAALERSYADDPLFTTHLPAGPAGVFAGASVDGDERLIAYRASDRLPLVGIASLDLGEVYRPWRQRTTWTVGLALAALVAVFALFRQVRRGLDREVLVRGELQAANASLDETNRNLADALAQKEVLFREVHHRVTNNLQIVTSLLRMQSTRTSDGETRDALRATLNRVDSMALLHRVLYRTDQAAGIDFGRYLEELCEHLAEAFALSDQGIALSVDAEACPTDLDHAVPIALAVNEAITNAIKHAFPDGRRGSILVRVRRDGLEATVEVCDDGVGAAGMAPGMAPGMDAASPGIGRTLLRRLVQQAGGRHELEVRDGTTFRVVFPVDGRPTG